MRARLSAKRWGLASALVVFGAWLFALLLGACSLTTDLSGLVRTADVADSGAGPFSLGGTVSGLNGMSITLVANGDDLLVLSDDGPFTFKSQRATGDNYVVTVVRAPAGHTCTVNDGTGRIGAADVTNIRVDCPSNDARLAKLSISRGALSPVFDPSKLAYAVDLAVTILRNPAITVTAIAKDPGASITINGTPVASGQPSASISLNQGVNTILIEVRAADGVSQSAYTIVANGTSPQEAYIKASNARRDSNFASALALSADGTTLAVGAFGESSGAIGVNGNQGDTSEELSGAVYVFTRANGVWSQQAYLKASNTQYPGVFGIALALSSDGSTLAVGSELEASNAVGINGDQADRSAVDAGAAYLFTRTGAGSAATWTQQAYIKASNTRANAHFGSAMALSPDGATLAIGSYGESSGAKGVNGNANDTSASTAGAVYVFGRDGTGAATTWSQRAYIKASNARTNSAFGTAVALSSDGSTLAVGAAAEPSAAKGVGGDQGDTSAYGAGAAYVFRRVGGNTTGVWAQEAYVKASNTRKDALFGVRVALSSDGTTLAVGAIDEASASRGINGDQEDSSGWRAGAVYIFTKAGTGALAKWAQQAYVKASNTNTDASARFGGALTLSSSGSTLAVGAVGEKSNAVGVNGNQRDVSATYAGAAYLFTRSGASWSQVAYLKASNARSYSEFGVAVALSADGATLAVGAVRESSATSGINGNQDSMTQTYAGAAYVFH